MHSPRVDRVRSVARAALLTACAVAGVAQAQDDEGAAPAAPAASSTDPRALRIEAAADKLRADPALSGRHKEHRLRWNFDDETRKRQDENATLVAWLKALANFINDTSRFLFWGVVAVLVALGLVGARHLVQLRSFRRRAAAESAVSHVRDMDVRPESLPEDVGAAAWALWQAGQVAAALSLLYRGTLSRLIHRFELPITASATEGECLSLARGRLEPAALRYVTQVVRAREASIYGGRALSAAMGESLCTGFAERLDGATPFAPQGPAQ
jgi:hypothetical protein